jgi:hypothetical protein
MFVTSFQQLLDAPSEKQSQALCHAEKTSES